MPGTDRLKTAAQATLCATLAGLSAGSPLGGAPARAAGDHQDVIGATLPAVVMVLAAKVEKGRIVPVSSGSGTIVTSNGSVLTNHHVIFDGRARRAHELFLIGLFRGKDRQPALVCAGRPSEGLLEPEMDLALIRCSMDRNGRPWEPKHWPTIPRRDLKREPIAPGEQIWVLGYPNVEGGTPHATAGLVSGWTDEHGGAGSRAFMKTDAAISRGNSGGTAIDVKGRLVGVPTAIRETRSTRGGATVSAGRIGLIRPLSRARTLLSQAGATSGPSAEVADQPGVIVRSRVIDATNRRGVADATVLVLRSGVSAGQIRREKLEQQALSWGRTDPNGEFHLQIPLARGNTHTVIVVAPGYLPRSATDALQIAANSPAELVPWKHISLHPGR